jgi:hypothetical protein
MDKFVPPERPSPSAHSRAFYAAHRNSRTSFKICRKAGSGARHMVRYVSRKGSHAVRSLLCDFRV